MNRERFRVLVAEAMDEIPEPFQSRLANVEVVVEDEPDDELLEDMGLDPEQDTLFGLYEGTPLDERGDSDPMALPDRIIIYYLPLVEAFPTPTKLRREIRKTIVHEVGHFFGFDDGDLEREGY
jgi:predicted Zn-dependent protease with MMP-like domain